MAINVELHAAYDPKRLAIEWRSLEDRATASFFTSWTWIGCWLEAVAQTPLLVRATDGALTVALGLLSRHQAKRNVLRVDQLLLHETGISNCDRISIEHNGFLVDRGMSAEILDHIFSALQTNLATQPWNELVLSGVTREYVEASRRGGLNVELDRESPNIRVDLGAFRRAHQTWRATLSKNLRGQIRQSSNQAQQRGSVVLERASTAASALLYFEGLVELHTSYWRSKKRSGAFASDFSLKFHRSLISQGIAQDAVQLLRLSAGEETLGYLYNFIYRGTVSNYQSGFVQLTDNRLRPGLLSHALAIEKYLGEGCMHYDFLAGAAPYKLRMGSEADELLWLRVQRPSWKLRAESLARRLKNNLRSPAAGY